MKSDIEKAIEINDSQALGVMKDFVELMELRIIDTLDVEFSQEIIKAGHKAIQALKDSIERAQGCIDWTQVIIDNRQQYENDVLFHTAIIKLMDIGSPTTKDWVQLYSDCCKYAKKSQEIAINAVEGRKLGGE